MENTKFNHETVRDLIDQGYHVIAAGVPKKIEGDLWEYLDGLDDREDVLVLTDLLKWGDDDLARIGKQVDNPKVKLEDLEMHRPYSNGEVDASYAHVLYKNSSIGVGYFNDRTGRFIVAIINFEGEILKLGFDGYKFSGILHQLESDFEKSYI